MPHWKEFESLTAPGRDQAQRFRFIVSQEFVDKHFQINRLTPIFQTGAHLYGRLPEINLIESVRDGDPKVHLTTLDDSIACFEGIMRPHDDEQNGESVLIYVLRPSVTIERIKSMACQAGAVVPPKSTVLTVLVRTNVDLQDEDGPVDGIITRLEWVMAGDDGLPKRHESRYTTTHWERS